MQHLTYGTMIAASVPAVRRAQDRAMDAFMALPLTISSMEMERFAKALDRLESITDIAYLTMLIEEMQDLMPEEVKEERISLEQLLANIPQYEL